jgi:hypothetical protein
LIDDSLLGRLSLSPRKYDHEAQNDPVALGGIVGRRRRRPFMAIARSPSGNLSFGRWIAQVVSLI